MATRQAGMPRAALTTPPKMHVVRVGFVLQRVLLRLSYAYHRALRPRPRPEVVVGTEEIAAVLHNVGEAMSPSWTVCLRRPPYYTFVYDVDYSASKLKAAVMGPLELGRLAARHTTFVYVGGWGFLFPVDGRAFELGFLGRRGRRVVCIFTGSEIRSHELLNQFGRDAERDVITTYQPFVAPGADSEPREAQRRMLANVAEQHASVIVNAPVDQMGWFRKSTEPFVYLVPDDHIVEIPEKWDDLSRPVIVHAPTSPIIKGTPLVRAAVKKLQTEGYVFEYVELMNRTNEEVLRELRRAHIVLNQFYALLPGVFGLEAMAANTVMLASADPELEPSLPGDAAQAWVVTPYWDLTDRLRDLLDHPERLQQQANRGTAWVRENGAWSVGAARLRALLE